MTVKNWQSSEQFFDDGAIFISPPTVSERLKITVRIRTVCVSGRIQYGSVNSVLVLFTFLLSLCLLFYFLS
jgi:hypothetical protein